MYWYQGTDVDKTGNYMLSKTGTAISATIGLPYYGEMFSSYFGPYSGTIRTWLMTQCGGSYIWNFLNGNAAVYNYRPSSLAGVRPSFYLKSDVKISGGNGTADTPYEITQ